MSEEFNFDGDPEQDRPWRRFLPRSLADRARDAVAKAPEAVRAMVEATIEESAVDPEEEVSLREWLSWVAVLPWGRPAREEPVDMERAMRVLDAAHQGDDSLKARLLDRIMASWILGEAGRGHRPRPLLLEGPPGTGKSTLARATAEAMGLPCSFVSIPTAVHDSVFLVGAARAYRSAEPGAIIQAVRTAGTRRLVFVLDELDKIPAGSANDSPSAAYSLLELLDGRATWVDRYLGVPFDLSDAVFIATANSLDTIPEPVLDRCDVLRVPGLGPVQRLEAARTLLWPRLMDSYQLPESLVPIDDEALRRLVLEYAEPGEEGLRAVEGRLEACLMRAVRRGFDTTWPVPVNRAMIAECLGPAPPPPAPSTTKPPRHLGFAAPPSLSARDGRAPRGDQAPDGGLEPVR